MHLTDSQQRSGHECCPTLEGNGTTSCWNLSAFPIVCPVRSSIECTALPICSALDSIAGIAATIRRIVSVSLPQAGNGE